MYYSVKSQVMSKEPLCHWISPVLGLAHTKNEIILTFATEDIQALENFY